MFWLQLKWAKENVEKIRTEQRCFFVKSQFKDSSLFIVGFVPIKFIIQEKEKEWGVGFKDTLSADVESEVFSVFVEIVSQISVSVGRYWWRIWVGGDYARNWQRITRFKLEWKLKRVQVLMMAIVPEVFFFGTEIWLVMSRFNEKFPLSSISSNLEFDWDRK